MMKRSLSKVARLLTRRSSAAESGQAVIILALGFIALIAFVGIVTDVSLMFVRYSTLSRAVDSAAIAAAGQMRSDRNFGDVGIAARQFIEFHGLDPEEVLVETCQTSRGIDHDNDSNTPAQRDTVICPSDQRKLVRVTATINSPTLFMRLLGFPDVELTAVALSETAVLDVVILMDVSESMLFDTTYADWARIGMGKVYYPPAMGGNSEILIQDTNGNGLPDPADGLDTFSSLDDGTVYQKEFENQFRGNDSPTDNDANWVPATFDDPKPVVQKFWDDMVIDSTQEQISQRLTYQNGTSALNADPDYLVQTRDYPNGGTFPGATGVVEPRSLCRVRFWPNSIRVPILQDTKDAYRAVGLPPWPNIQGQTERSQWDGFVPTYNFYGCCNDPTAGGRVNEDGVLLARSPGETVTNAGDFQFNDLICQPFKQARDATRQFLDRIDFSRGDRVAFVTFDKMAFLIDPDGSQGGTTTPCPDVERVDATTGRTALTHMIETDCRAKHTLDTYVGVRAEPNSYVWKEDGGGWDGFADGLDEEGRSKRINYESLSVNDTTPHTDQRGMLALNTYPVRDHCPLQNGALEGLYSRYSLYDRTTNNQYVPSGGKGGPPAGLYRTMIPNPLEGTWAGSGIDERNSYELWASCRNTNIGAALRSGSNALLDPSTTRRTGTVWVMVLLGDGAAGGSDPVRQNGRRLSDGSFVPPGGGKTEISVYADWGTNRANWESYGVNTDGVLNANNIRYGTTKPGIRTEYGTFGLCPIGTPGGRSALTRIYQPGQIARFPFCSDEQPDSRHFCYAPGKREDEVGGECGIDGTLSGVFSYGFAPGAKDKNYECNPNPANMRPNETVEDYNLRRGNIYDLDIGDWPNNEPASNLTPQTCDPLYDVDDYARDWADYIGIAQGGGEQQLPIIFTIGFGLNFEIGSTGGTPNDAGYVPGPPSQNIPDYLGEELLRYIADVGDNNQIDTDYQQDWLDDGIRGNWGTGDLGPRGPCERPVESLPANPPAGTLLPIHAPLPARQSCGNYYNAPNRAQLELVFDDIASRMFTRLTG